MSSLDKQQATQEEIATTLREFLEALRTQHTDNEKLQQQMLFSNKAMTGATIVMAVATVVMAFSK